MADKKSFINFLVVFCFYCLFSFFFVVGGVVFLCFFVRFGFFVCVFVLQLKSQRIRKK